MKRVSATRFELIDRLFSLYLDFPTYPTRAMLLLQHPQHHSTHSQANITALQHRAGSITTRLLNSFSIEYSSGRGFMDPLKICHSFFPIEIYKYLKPIILQYKKKVYSLEVNHPGSW